MSSSFVHDLEYLTNVNAQVFIPLMRFLLQILVSRSFLIHLRYSYFIVYFSFLLVLWCPLQLFPSTYNFFFLRAFWFVFDLAVLCFSLWIWHIFLCQIPFLYARCILYVVSEPPTLCLLFKKSLMSSIILCLARFSLKF